MNIHQVLENDLCVGCGACTYLYENLEMRYSESGYLRPHVNNGNDLARRDPHADDVFSKVCPGSSLNLDQIEGKSRDVIWGYIEKLAVGYAESSTLRQSGSSGGVLSALSDYLLNADLVDGVINVSGIGGCGKNVTEVRFKGYDFSESAGSRYSPASPCEVLKEIDLSKTYAFVGKPCDVAAVAQLCNESADLDKSIKYKLSFMCAGTPSRISTEEIIKKFGFELEDVVSLRYRGNGWPGNTTAICKDGSHSSMSYSDSWGKILNKSLQTRCKICPDGIGEFADVVCADAWECDENGYPSFDERPGESMIIARTGAGLGLIEDAHRSNGLALTDRGIQLEDLKFIQPFQYYRKVSILARLTAFFLLRRVAPTYRNIGVLGAALRGGVLANLKSFVGLISRRSKIGRDHL